MEVLIKLTYLEKILLYQSVRTSFPRVCIARRNPIAIALECKGVIQLGDIVDGFKLHVYNINSEHWQVMINSIDEIFGDIKKLSDDDMTGAIKYIYKLTN